MLFDLTFPCYLTTFSGKKCLSGKVICVFFVPLIEVLLYMQYCMRLIERALYVKIVLYILDALFPI
jgi:hypothetical protein